MGDHVEPTAPPNGAAATEDTTPRPDPYDPIRQELRSRPTRSVEESDAILQQLLQRWRIIREAEAEADKATAEQFQCVMRELLTIASHLQMSEREAQFVSLKCMPRRCNHGEINYYAYIKEPYVDELGPYCMHSKGSVSLCEQLECGSLSEHIAAQHRDSNN